MIDWIKVNNDFNELMEEFPQLRQLCFDDDSDDPYGVSMIKIAALLLVLWMAKDKQYGASWAKNGDMGVAYNFKRKEDRIDRLSALAVFSADSEYHTVALADTLADRSNYGMMWLSRMSKINPEAFKEWLRTHWCGATGINYADIVRALGLEE